MQRQAERAPNVSSSRDVDGQSSRADRSIVAVASELLVAIRSTADHVHDPFDDTVVLDLEAHGYRLVVRREAVVTDDRQELSPREREIASMVARGYTNKAIAATLGISIFTVGSHLRRIFAKLGVMNRAGAVGALSSLPTVTVERHLRDL